MQKTLTKEKLASPLDGCEYHGGMANEIVEAAKKGDVNLIRKEAIQVAAVAVRLAVMLTPTDRAMRKDIDALEEAESETD